MILFGIIIYYGWQINNNFLLDTCTNFFIMKFIFYCKKIQPLNLFHFEDYNNNIIIQ